VDPFRASTTALTSGLPHPARVLGAFHITRLGFTAVDEVRRRVQRESTGHRGCRDDPLWRIRRACARRRPPHKPAGGRAGRPRHRPADHPSPDRRPGPAPALPLHRPGTGRRAAVLVVLPLLRHRNPPSCTAWPAQSTRGARSPSPTLCTVGVSNGPTEAVNLLIKKVHRTRHGFRNLQPPAPTPPAQRRRPAHVPTDPTPGGLPRLAA
jgi:transposase